MVEHNFVNFLIAVGFVAISTLTIIFFFVYSQISSGKRLNRAQRFASSVIEFTPELILIMFDAEGIVTNITSEHTFFKDRFLDEYSGKHLSQIDFLPVQLRPSNFSDLQQQPSQFIERLSNCEENHLIKWASKSFKDIKDKTEFNVILGFDITELVKTQDKLKATLSHLAAAEELERKRIAEDLHDRIGEISILSTLKINELKKSDLPPEVSTGLEDLNSTLRTFLQKTRSLIFDLVPPILYDIGLLEAISFMANEFIKKHNVVIEVTGHFTDTPSQELAVFLLKSVREFILNAIKHGGADKMEITLSQPEHKFVISVVDNGEGFANFKMKENLNLHSGFGLFHIKNRVEHYCGDLSYNSSEKLGGGIVTISVPVELTQMNEIL